MFSTGMHAYDSMQYIVVAEQFVCVIEFYGVCYCITSVSLPVYEVSECVMESTSCLTGRETESVELGLLQNTDTNRGLPDLK